ncbi:craniofacial development protein 2-like [Strongylocentrotus purpuratus]|uniref:Endonuclease/exonuclease/phosphatase domain-containing protein n=1 Tax=Strongylocentrotus purpuratus TaxID=7668 RepID=A0A7M7HII9_STRPU|nr:craniofacial development protein 2-like [Strongylocentrotus purpuratus]
MGCRPVSRRLITIRLKASHFNITIIQAYAPTTDYDDDVIEDFYDQLQKVKDQTPKKDIIVVQGDWNAKIGEDASKNWKGTCGQYCNHETNERGLRLLEFAKYNYLKVVNTFGQHKPCRRWTWHSPGGQYHNQIDYIMVKGRFQSSANIAKTRSFPGADVGSGHELATMTFKLRLQRMKSQGNKRIRSRLEKLKDPNIAEIFRATIGGKFAPLLVLGNQDPEIDTLINRFNTAVTETASDILGKHRPTKKPWVTVDILKLCDKRR